ncbi:MAG: mandelate racemase/muconate lactonizing enzyme family protein [Treponema sp.]|jgi:L-alanine-DL-glutamate epimerase-like enolase superfamily enzyme|nr:mandelate racemase/muconate lactonizing enzyme family protein [Treponema sp.]
MNESNLSKKPGSEYAELLNFVKTGGKPSGLKITDVRFTDIVDAPMHCTIMKVYTNQGIVGYGEVRDGATRTYALVLKNLLIGENPCNIDKIFRKIKQYGYHSRQAGGVCAVEVALWDLAGKAYGVPIYQMLGGKFRDKIRCYCDTDVEGKHSGKDMGKALKERMDKGFTFLKMDLGIGLLFDVPGTLTAPLGFLEEFRSKGREYHHYLRSKNKLDNEFYALRNAAFDVQNVAHPFTGIRITEKGLDYLEQYVKEVREVIGWDIPLAIDHFGHLGVEDCIKLARRIEPYNIAWAEDMIPWQMTGEYVRLRNSTTTPIATGEDIYLKEGFRPLLEAGGVAVIHPDILSSGGILENKKIGDLAQEYGVAMAVHMAETPIAAMACVHSIAATENFLVLENHSVDVPWWDDLVKGLPKPIVNRGYIDVPDKPGLGIDELNEELIAEHIHPLIPGQWEPTDNWNFELSNNRLWS